MMPPHNRSISQLAREEGISEATLYNWRNEARSKGILLPDGDTGPEGWNAQLSKQLLQHLLHLSRCNGATNENVSCGKFVGGRML